MAHRGRRVEKATSGICVQKLRKAGPIPSRRKFVRSAYGCARPSGRNALVAAEKHTPLASATATAPTATALSRSAGSAPCGEKPWYSATAAAGPSPTPRVIPSATYPCTSPWRPGGADSAPRVKNAGVPTLDAAPVRTRFVSTAQPAGNERSAEAPARSTRESTRGPRRPKASTIHPANGRSASWATPIAPSMKPMPRASWPWSCRNRGSMAVTPKWTAVHSVSPLVRARTLRVSDARASNAATMSARVVIGRSRRAVAWDADGGGPRRPPPPAAPSRPPPAASHSCLGDAGLHGLDQLGRNGEPVVLHRVLSRLLQDVVHGRSPRDELAGRARHVGAPQHLLHLDLLHGLSSCGGRSGR